MLALRDRFEVVVPASRFMLTLIFVQRTELRSSTLEMYMDDDCRDVVCERS